MNAMRNRWMAAAFGALALGLLGACEVTGVGVDGSVGVGYAAGYYEPYGYEYGGWGPGYRVGPGRGGDHRDDRGGGRRPDVPRQSHTYRPAPASRPTPSIPNRSRGH
ncbi:MAG TPA: hypothetical protein VKG63_07315 [Steroidobacteraceae bacterium]|nr:hypothetical protein [Steroidobacteraceae bacterium]